MAFYFPPQNADFSNPDCNRRLPHYYKTLRDVYGRPAATLLWNAPWNALRMVGIGPSRWHGNGVIGGFSTR